MKVIASLVERGVWTYLQALATILLAGSVITGDLATAAAVAAIPAGLTVVTAGLPTSIDGVPFAVDAVYRTARTYAVTFVGLLVAIPAFTLDYSVLAAASTAGVTAAIAVAKTLIAQHIGTGSAATLPGKLDVEPPDPTIVADTYLDGV